MLFSIFVSAVARNIKILFFHFYSELLGSVVNSILKFIFKYYYLILDLHKTIITVPLISREINIGVEIDYDEAFQEKRYD